MTTYRVGGHVARQSGLLSWSGRSPAQIVPVRLGGSVCEKSCIFLVLWSGTDFPVGPDGLSLSPRSPDACSSLLGWPSQGVFLPSYPDFWQYFPVVELGLFSEALINNMNVLFSVQYYI